MSTEILLKNRNYKYLIVVIVKSIKYRERLFHTIAQSPNIVL